MFHLQEKAITHNRRPTIGEILLFHGYCDEALPYLERACYVDNTTDAWGNLGVCYKHMGDYPKAEKYLLKAKGIDPGVQQNYHNLALVYEEQGRFDEALEYFSRASMILKTPDTLYGLANALLRKGDFEHAAPLWDIARVFKHSWAPVPNVPLWRGEDLHGKRILVVREGGYGDVFWLLRYLEPLKQRGGHVTFHVFDSQKTLLTGHPWLDQVNSSEDPIDGTQYDYQMPLWSLMLVYNDFQMPMREPYIHVEASHAYPQPAVGIAWEAGEALTVYRKMRSIQSEYLYHFARVRDIHWVSLQRGKPLPWAAANVTEPSDWLETARAISGLDLVICADSSVMHLAAAMGKEVWAFVGLGKDWKFCNSAPDKIPFYPNVRVFTNPDPVSFEPVVKEMATALMQWAKQFQPEAVACAS